MLFYILSVVLNFSGENIFCQTYKSVFEWCISTTWVKFCFHVSF